MRPPAARHAVDDAAVDVELTPTGRRLLENRYLRPLPDGTLEEPVDLFRRVARAVAEAEDEPVRAGWADAFFSAMVERRYLPNAPTLLGAGRETGQLHACFVLPVEDSVDAVFSTLREAAIVHARGGGTGFSFSRLRARGRPVSSGGVTPGPVPMLSVFDAETEVLKQGGTGWGANMGVLRVDHPDVVEFARSKSGGGLVNFNISVGITDAFMAAVDRGEPWDLVDPASGDVVRTVAAREIWDVLCTEAWRTGDPGLLFLDAIEAGNPTPHLGRLEATNPCGEAPLLPYESCCLGGINVARFVDDRATDVDVAALAETAALATRMMDDVLTVARYPLAEVAEKTLRTRKVGIGVMGFADLLIALGIPYDSTDAESLASRVMAAIADATHDASVALAVERGPYPGWLASGDRPQRNATTTSNAPNSTIGPIAGASPGIEPLFSIAVQRHLRSGETLSELHPGFVETAKRMGFASEELFADVRASGSVAGDARVPEAVRAAYVTAHEISPHWHVRIQAAFQARTDLGVSKTINLPSASTPRDVDAVFRLAHRLRCKGLTVFRDGCLDGQFLTSGAAARDETEGCPTCPT